MWVDCEDHEAELLSTRITAYLDSIGTVGVRVVRVEEIQPSLSKK